MFLAEFCHDIFFIIFSNDRFSETFVQFSKQLKTTFRIWLFENMEFDDEKALTLKVMTLGVSQ